MFMNADSPRRLRDSAVFRLVVIGALILALLVPLAMVGTLVHERIARRDQAAEEIAATWGGRQTVGGPVLVIPYDYRRTNELGKVVKETDLAFFLPETLEVNGTITPELRRRGIFESAVYRSRLELAGAFARPDFGAWGVDERDVRWHEAAISFGISDLRGVGSDLAFEWRGEPGAIEPGTAGVSLWLAGLTSAAPLPASDGVPDPYSFRLKIGVAGSDGLDFLPLGKETLVVLTSPWPDPSFGGAFLPETRTITNQGFEARWRVSYYGRGYPQKWRRAVDDLGAAFVTGSAFGVGLYLPADLYQKAERSTKYGVLFLLLTFVTVFLYEVLSGLRVHPVQYLLVGGALCIFYLLLLSLAEHIPFAVAYALAATATITTIGLYAAAMLRGGGRALLLSGILAALYSYLYVLLQAEDYALLLGSAGLFLILGLVMYVTRKVDWYRLGAPAVEA
jgi:inner membrane protein